MYVLSVVITGPGGSPAIAFGLGNNEMARLPVIPCSRLRRVSFIIFSSLFVVLRRLAQLGIRFYIVFDPKLCAGLFKESFNGGSRRGCLFGIEFSSREPVERPFLRKVIQITAQDDGTGFG